VKCWNSERRLQRGVTGDTGKGPNATKSRRVTMSRDARSRADIDYSFHDVLFSLERSIVQFNPVCHRLTILAPMKPVRLEGDREIVCTTSLARDRSSAPGSTFVGRNVAWLNRDVTDRGSPLQSSSSSSSSSSLSSTTRSACERGIPMRARARDYQYVFASAHIWLSELSQT